MLQVHAGMPPYTDTKGNGKIRVGKDCQPLTGSMRRQAMAGTGESDITAIEVPGQIADLVSAAAMERLRGIAAQEQAPAELLRKSDAELLGSIGLIRRGQLTRGGLLLVGKEQAIAEVFAGYAWIYLHMQTDTAYDERADGRDCIAVALERIVGRIMPHNPLTTIQQGLFHFEFRTYPEIALREALLNAFCHADYRISGPIQLKQSHDRLEITNPGGLIGGVSPSNILRHDPVSRNPLLVNALIALRLVNRSNLGVRRMYEAMLQEGKEPPVIRDEGDAVRVCPARQRVLGAVPDLRSRRGQPQPLALRRGSPGHPVSAQAWRDRPLAPPPRFASSMTGKPARASAAWTVSTRILQGSRTRQGHNVAAPRRSGAPADERHSDSLAPGPAGGCRLDHRAHPARPS